LIPKADAVDGNAQPPETRWLAELHHRPVLLRFPPGAGLLEGWELQHVGWWVRRRRASAFDQLLAISLAPSSGAAPGRWCRWAGRRARAGGEP